MSVSEMTVAIEAKAGAPTTLRVSGAIDVENVSRLYDAAMEATHHGRDVHVDCEHVDFFDLAALQVLWAIKDELERRGTHLVFQGVSASLEGWLRLAATHSASIGVVAV